MPPACGVNTYRPREASELSPSPWSQVAPVFEQVHAGGMKAAHRFSVCLHREPKFEVLPRTELQRATWRAASRSARGCSRSAMA